MDNFGLYVILTRPAIGHVAAAEIAVRRGVRMLQLREKDLPDGELLHIARRVREVTRGTATRFIVNDRPDIALIDIEQILTIDPSDAEAYVMKGDIHLTQKKKDEAQKAYEQAIAHGIPRPELNDRLLQCR